jgi:phosphoribosyl 1,2-cyclic phosphate phosphodiesterase
MRIVILGCGGSAGVPMLGGADGTGEWGVCDPGEPRNRRTRSSIMIEGEDGRRLLVDTGPDLREQLLRCGIGRIDALLYSHAHADHVAGLDEMRGLNRTINRPIETFATRPILDEITQRFGYAFRPWSPPGFFRPVLTPREIEPGRTITIEGLTLQLFEQIHGHSITLGLRTGGFAYSTDVVRLDQHALDVLRDVDTWVVDCFQRAPHPAHADLGMVRRWSEQLGIRRTILTHMGTDMDWAWMTENLPPGIEAAFDGMQVFV